MSEFEKHIIQLIVSQEQKKKNANLLKKHNLTITITGL